MICMLSKGVEQYENSQFTITYSDLFLKAIHNLLKLGMFAECFQKLGNAIQIALDKILISLLIIKIKSNLYIYKLFNDTAL